MTEHLYRTQTATEVRERPKQEATIMIRLPPSRSTVITFRSNRTTRGWSTSLRKPLAAPKASSERKQRRESEFPGGVAHARVRDFHACYEKWELVDNGKMIPPDQNVRGVRSLQSNPGRGNALAESAIHTLIAFAGVFREMEMQPDVDLNYRDEKV